MGGTKNFDSLLVAIQNIGHTDYTNSLTLCDKSICYWFSFLFTYNTNYIWAHANRFGIFPSHMQGAGEMLAGEFGQPDQRSGLAVGSPGGAKDFGAVEHLGYSRFTLFRL